MKIVLSFVLAYIIGSLSISIFLSRIVFGADVRDGGSGNAGATNMGRRFGKAAGALTLAGDLLKTVLAIFLGKTLAGDWGIVTACVGCVLGHCFPAWHHFKGGKGVAVGLAITACIGWQVTVCVLVSFAIVVALTRKVSLGSIVATLSSIPAAYIVTTDRRYFWMTVIVASVILARHSANIRRLIRGEEEEFRFADGKRKEGQQK